MPRNYIDELNSTYKSIYESYTKANISKSDLMRIYNGSKSKIETAIHKAEEFYRMQEKATQDDICKLHITTDVYHRLRRLNIVNVYDLISFINSGDILHLFTENKVEVIKKAIAEKGYDISCIKKYLVRTHYLNLKTLDIDIVFDGKKYSAIYFSPEPVQWINDLMLKEFYWKNCKIPKISKDELISIINEELLKNNKNRG